MIIRSATLSASAADWASCPPAGLPEFALIGRSNVGKSSLINLLTRRAGLARVSATPGKTKLIHFFTINGQWNLVDLPGYGYAKSARSERVRFDRLISDYLEKRTTLRGTLVLIDIRLTPQEIDLTFLRWMSDRGLPLVLVFTKADKVSAAAGQRSVGTFLARVAEFSSDAPEVIITSSETGAGRNELLGLVAGALEDPAA